MLAVIGMSFAYFSLTAPTNAQSVIVNTANIGSVTFTNGSTLSLTNALPGASTNVQFSIKSDNNSKGNYTIPYTIYWSYINNGFTTKGDLVYSVSCTGGGPTTNGEVQVPASGTPDIIDGNLVVESKQVTHTCTLAVKFKETGSNQNDNQNKTFTGTIGVKLKKPYFNNSNKSGVSTAPTKQ